MNGLGVKSLNHSKVETTTRVESPQRPIRLHPIHHRHHARDHCAKRLSTKGSHARGMSMKGSFVVSLTITQVSLQLAYQVKVSLPKQWS